MNLAQFSNEVQPTSAIYDPSSTINPLTPTESFGYFSTNTLSELSHSFSTEQITSSHRTSQISNDNTQVNFLFKFEHKIQSNLRSLNSRSCKSCKSAGSLIERKIIQTLSMREKFSYFFHSLCCNDPKSFKKFLKKRRLCVYCGKIEE